MLQDAHDKLRPALVGRDHGFRWRGIDISRIEALSDAVFALAIALLVVSLEVPKTFAQLRESMHGVFAFGVCFALLLMIWHAQYIYFRRYALDDRTTLVLNAALLFVVAFFIYPLKFLFTTVVDRVTGYQPIVNGIPVPDMSSVEKSELMMIYSAGFIGLYVIFALLYLHAYRQRDALELSALETYETRTVVREQAMMISIGVAAIALAWTQHPSLSGLTYVLIVPLQAVLGARNGRKRQGLAALHAPVPTTGEHSTAIPRIIVRRTPTEAAIRLGE